ncbi:hypothetical protein [Caldinitratiruptor microaerophilus]|uniref:Uncharacterized protein n=1 Tax=Caldinitratiruptor microaerophilus TaxID=671077 RepID=A0AA35CIQ5_9FIRM|nr:hypothetical protein [Caldinitratiruptor microaerophilus]BDG59083.1 hypothetical protein caldi_01730 [Caldinitratiruptor microaerophilus]
MTDSLNPSPLSRLARLADRQERLAVRIGALAGAPPVSAGLAIRSAPALVSVSDGSVVRVARAAGSRRPGAAAGDRGDETVSGAEHIFPARQAEPEAGTDASAAGDPGDGAARVEAQPGRPAPVAGAQVPALGMWRPARGETIRRDRRIQVTERVETLRHHVRVLSQTAQRLESICHLLGECVLLACDPQAAGRGIASTSTGETGAHGDGEAGKDSGGGNAGLGALLSLLPGLLRSGGETGGSPEAGGGQGAGAPGGDGAPAAGDGASGEGQMAALIQLLQYLAARSSRTGEDLVSRLAGILGSPAIRGLLGQQAEAPGPN